VAISFNSETVWDVTPCSLEECTAVCKKSVESSSLQKMEAIRSGRTSRNSYHKTRCHYRENFKPRITLVWLL